MKRLSLLFILVVFAGGADIATTTYGVEYDERFVESNEIVADAMEEYGTIIGHTLLKLLAVSLFGILTTLAPDEYKRVALVPPIVIWGGAAIWNLFIIL